MFACFPLEAAAWSCACSWDWSCAWICCCRARCCGFVGLGAAPAEAGGCVPCPVPALAGATAAAWFVVDGGSGSGGGGGADAGDPIIGFGTS